MQNLGEFDRHDWIPIYNDSGEEIPPGALIRLAGQNEDRQFLAQKPDADSQAWLVVNGPVTVPVGGEGMATYLPYVWAAFDMDSLGEDGEVAIGDCIGSVAGSWYLHFGQGGFRAEREIDEATEMILVQRGDCATGDNYIDVVTGVCAIYGTPDENSPSGSAGGDLDGSYPNPTLRDGSALRNGDTFIGG